MKKVVISIIILFIIMIANISYATEEERKEVTIGETYTLQSDLNLRLMPTLSSNAKIKMKQNTEVTVDMKIGKWCKITDGTVAGWITETKVMAEPNESIPEEEPEPEENGGEGNTQNETPTNNSPETVPEEVKPEPTTSNRKGVVNVETARVRKSASTSSDIIATLDEDDIVNIIGEENGFYKITTSTITEGYVSSSLVKEKDVTSRSSIETREETPVTSVTGSSVVEFAKQYLGYSYVLGGSLPSSGFDCSGFTRYVFSNFGYTLGRVAADQTSLGAIIERGNLQSGDLLLFYDDAKTKIGHCGIYISGGDFIHSANPTRGVVIDNLNTNSYYSTRFVTARRLVGAI